ncbi:MAG: hypothetical protein ACLUDG_02885 [Butyricicoccus sp.]
MFDWFFSKYREEVYRIGLRRITTAEKVMLGILIISSSIIICISTATIFNIQSSLLYNIFGAALVFLLCDSIVFTVYEIKQEKNIDRYEHKIEQLQQLEDLLNKYNLYTHIGLDWLIECCTVKIGDDKNKVSSIIHSLMFPVILSAYGVILNNLSYTEIIRSTFSVVALIFTIYIADKYVLSNIVSLIKEPYKDVYKYLKAELQYLKTQLH